MASKNETSEAVIRDMREYAEQSKIDGGEVNVWDWLSEFADRFEASHRREIEELRECLSRRSSHLNAILQKALELREDVPVGLRKVMDDCIVAEDEAVGLGVFSVKKGANDGK